MSNKDLYILGIESSCDDTSASILKNGKVLSNVIVNQNIHKKYGGVVPELASRAHLSNIIPVVDSALKESKVSIKEISAIAFTRGPGLMGSLIIGTEFAKELGLSLNVPVIDVNHMQAHLLVHFIKNDLKKLWSLSNIDFQYIIRNWSVVIIVILALLFNLIGLSELGNVFGTPTYPRTWKMLQAGATFTLVINEDKLISELN